MLVVTRKRHERILIGDDIEVVITWIGRGQVRMGIIAPKETRILRKEIAERYRKHAASSDHAA
jgi:carbon storage regulator